MLISKQRSLPPTFDHKDDQAHKAHAPRRKSFDFAADPDEINRNSDCGSEEDFNVERVDS